MYAMKKPILQKDVIIIGAGMAGLTAALYASRLQLSVLVLENGIVGGQIANATNIENYPGFLQVSGKELIETLTQQAEHFGAILDEFDTIERVSLKETPKIIETADHIYKASAVIIASGMNRRRQRRCRRGEFPHEIRAEALPHPPLHVPRRRGIRPAPAG